MNSFLATIILILFPGIIATIVCDKIASHSKWDSFKFSLYVLVHGVLAYTLLQIILYVIYLMLIYWGVHEIYFLSRSIPVEMLSKSLHVWDATSQNSTNIYPREIIFASICAILNALWISFLINYKCMTKFAQKMRISKKYGDENLFTFYLESNEVVWVYIRDKENNLTYKGKVLSFSENDRIQEVVLEAVSVYRYEDSEFLYDISSVYLTKEQGKFVIENILPDLEVPNEK